MEGRRGIAGEYDEKENKLNEKPTLENSKLNIFPENAQIFKIFKHQLMFKSVNLNWQGFCLFTREKKNISTTILFDVGLKLLAHSIV